jgi:hypothetical protein
VLVTPSANMPRIVVTATNILEGLKTQQLQSILMLLGFALLYPTYELIVPVWGELAIATLATGIRPAR